MAEPEEIAAVQAMLGGAEKAEQNGWTEEKIAALLDAGDSENSIAALYWEERYAATSELIDISESGSSRGLSAVTRNAANLAKLYRDRADAETVVPPTPVQRGIRSHRMTRV